MDDRMDVRMPDIEGLCRGFLQNAAARHWAVARAGPEAPTAEYLTGLGAGWEAGHVAALALVVSMLSGDSISTLIAEADAEAAVESAFPFDLIVESAEVGSAPMSPAPTCAAPQSAAPPQAA